MCSTIPKDWLPEILEVNVSEDLIAELRCCQPGLFRRIAEIRAEHGAEGPFVRFRDEPYLACRTYTVSVHGIRIAWGTLEKTQSLEDELVRAVAAVWQANHDGLQFLVEWQAAAATPC